jgi:hypothetical protein
VVPYAWSLRHGSPGVVRHVWSPVGGPQAIPPGVSPSGVTQQGSQRRSPRCFHPGGATRVIPQWGSDRVVAPGCFPKGDPRKCGPQGRSPKWVPLIIPEVRSPKWGPSSCPPGGFLSFRPAGGCPDGSPKGLPQGFSHGVSKGGREGESI